MLEQKLYTFIKLAECESTTDSSRNSYDTACSKPAVKIS